MDSVDASVYLAPSFTRYPEKVKVMSSSDKAARSGITQNWTPFMSESVLDQSIACYGISTGSHVFYH